MKPNDVPVGLGNTCWVNTLKSSLWRQQDVGKYLIKTPETAAICRGGNNLKGKKKKEERVKEKERNINNEKREEREEKQGNGNEITLL